MLNIAENNFIITPHANNMHSRVYYNSKKIKNKHHFFATNWHRNQGGGLVKFNQYLVDIQ